MNQELRLYTFVNFYLSSIQQGIQTAHVVHSLFTKYQSCEQTGKPLKTMLFDWAQNHKTIVVLNGGANNDIREIMYKMECLQHTRIGYMPFEGFNEDDMSLGSILTSVGVVVPQKFYEARKVTPEGPYVYNGLDNSGSMIKEICMIYEPDTPEYTFVDMLKSCSLAR